MNWNQGAEQFLTALSSAEPTPGGGAAAAMAGAMGCALILMSIGPTLKRKSTPQGHKDALQKAQQKISGLHVSLKKLMEQDAQAYETYMTARRLPLQETTREQALQDALWFAACVPADIAATSVQALQALHALEPLIAPIILSDICCAKHLLKAAIMCGIENIQINLQGITDPTRVENLQNQIHTFEREIK